MLKSAVHAAFVASKISDKNKGVSAAPSHVEEQDADMGNSQSRLVCCVWFEHLTCNILPVGQRLAQIT